MRDALSWIALALLTPFGWAGMLSLAILFHALAVFFRALGACWS